MGARIKKIDMKLFAAFTFAAVFAQERFDEPIEETTPRETTYTTWTSPTTPEKTTEPTDPPSPGTDIFCHTCHSKNMAACLEEGSELELPKTLPSVKLKCANAMDDSKIFVWVANPA